MKSIYKNLQVSFTFHRWSRRPFAALSSMNKVVKVGVLLVSYSILTQPGKTYAQADSSQVINNLREVVVSAQRAPVVYSNVARVVHVVPRSEIEKAPVLSLNELLDYLPGVDIRQRGNNGVQADVSIQGGTFDQTMILLNGINISDPQTGHLSMNLPLDLESVGRVEVLNGSASRVFGANAFCGAINIITTPTERNFIRASAMAGDFGLYKAGATAQYTRNSIYNHLSYYKSASNGYYHNTDYNSQSAFYQGGIKKAGYLINLQGGISTKNYGANSFYSSRYPDQYEENKTLIAGINSVFGHRLKFKPALYWKRNYDHYILIKDNPAAYQNFHFTDVYGFNLNSEYKWLAGTTTIGLEYRNESLYSTRLGLKTSDSLRVKGQDNLYYNKHASRYNYSIFLEHSFQYKIMTVSGGFMINHYSALDKNLVIYPGVDMACELNSWSKWYFTVNKSLRLPTFTDLYYTGPFNENNVDLKPEEATQYETGFKFFRSGISGNISGFYRKGKNIIDLILQTDNNWKPENITDLQTKGLEVSTQVDFVELLGRELFFNNAGISYNYTEINKDAGAFISAYVLDNLKHKLSIHLNHQLYKKLSAVWYLNWQERNGSYDKYDPVTKTSTQTNYSPFWLLDGRIQWNPRNLKFYAEVSNILNVNYFDLGNIVQPGRWFKIGASIDIGI